MDAIKEQRKLVNNLYYTEGMSDNYEREFDKLSKMRKLSMADSYRKSRGLSDQAKTPYCDNKPRIRA
jgi:hypothetical protein